jgi:hypothetical protein
MDLTVFFLGCSLDTLYFGFDAILIKCAHTMHACSYIYIYIYIYGDKKTQSARIYRDKVCAVCITLYYRSIN